MSSRPPTAPLTIALRGREEARLACPLAINPGSPHVPVVVSKLLNVTAPSIAGA